MDGGLLDDDDFAEAPDDPHLAFAFLEGRARDRVRQQTDHLENSQSIDSYLLEYITAVLSIADFLKIPDIQHIAMPTPGTFKHGDYQRISQQIISKVYQIKAANAERSRLSSVALTTAEKAKIADKLSKLRDAVNASLLDDKHRARLLELIADFEQELAKKRTNFAKFLHVGLILAAVHGAAGTVDDAVKLYDGAVRILGVAKSNEDEQRPSLQLPPPPKQLIAPKDQPKESFPEDLDDEIPF